MSNWKNLVGIDLEKLEENRKSMHQAVQIVSAFPRALLPYDATDGTASLVWNESYKSLESLPVISDDGNITIRVGLSLDTFDLYVQVGENINASIGLTEKSTNEGLIWLKEKLEAIDISPDKLNLDFPYEIEAYDFNSPLKVTKDALNEHMALYHNTNHLLERVIEKWSKAFDIRCWPHHFDLATLIPLETDENDEILKSIGVGLSPGDDTIPEPYVYVNVWPSIDYELLKKHNLNSGYWNKEGWSGAVLTYSQLLNQPDQKSAFENFIAESIEIVISEVG